MRKVSKNPRKKLYKELDKLQREILFKKFGKKCVQCGSTNKVGTGHVFSRRHLNTRWDIHPAGNAFPQCWGCNYRHVRDQYPYFEWFKKEWGEGAFQLLRKRHETIVKISTPELREMVEEYKKLTTK